MAKKLFFFYDSFTRYLVSFMSIWTNTYIQTVFKDEQVLYNVPIVYGHYDKYQELRRFIEERGRNYLSGYQNTPIISISDKGFTFDTDRDLVNNYNQNIHHSNEKDLYLKNRIPVPVTYKFEMKIWVTYLNHLSQIMEQVFPYIMRPFTLKLFEFPDIKDIKRAVTAQTVTKDININYEEEKSATQSGLKQRVIPIEFEIKGHMYFPLSKDDGFIKKIQVEYESGTTGEKYGTQTVEAVNEFIDYLELLKIKEIESNGGFQTTNEDGVSVLNSYIRGEDYLYKNETVKDILEMMNGTSTENGE